MDPNYFNPSMYQNVPASEVNWAQLAQRWIVARNLAPSNVPMPRPLMGGPPVQPPAFPSPYMDPKSMHTPNVYPPMPIKPPPVNIIYPPAHSGFFSRPALNVMPPNMPYGGLPPPIRSGLSAGPSTSYVEPNFICEDEEEQYGAHFDPSLTSDDAETEQNETGAMSHWISGMTESSDQSGDLPHDWMDPSWMPNAVDTSKFQSTSGIPSLMSLSFLNQQDRKKLPAWILEGLEKAEKEKQKKLEKEERLKEAEKNAKLRQEQRASMGLSKFDSDSDASDKELEEETTNYETKNLPLLEEDPVFLAKRGYKEEADKDEEQSSEDEEKREELKQLGLLTIRRLMTAVLLESTDEELNRIANQVYSESKSRAQPKILVQSSALAALSALGDGESESSDEETDNTSTTKNGQNHKSDRDAATFKAPSLPTVPKLRSGELSNGSNSLATVEREDLKHNVESTVKGESVDRREDKNMKSNEIPPKHTSETRSGKRDRSDERDSKEYSKSHKERSKRSRSRSRERTSKRDKDRDNGKKRSNRKRDDDDLRQRGDSSESSKKHRHNVEDRKRSRSRSRSRDRAHRSSKHSRRRSRSSS